MRTLPRSVLLLALTGVTALALAALLLLPAVPAAAQCSGSSSTCTSCHEIKARLPVNTVGAWHTDHALTDACATCHKGDKAASDPAVAHTAMVDPLADPAASCAACHKDNAGALAAIYAELMTQQAVSVGPVAVAQSAPADPMDAPLVTGDPMDAPPASGDPMDAPLNVSAAAPADDTAPADDSGNKALVVTAEALMIIGLGTVFLVERKR
jgi:hypothetical protein